MNTEETRQAATTTISRKGNKKEETLRLFRVMTPEAREAFNAEGHAIDAALKADWAGRHGTQKEGFLKIARRFGKRIMAGKFGLEIKPRNANEADEIEHELRLAGVEVNSSPARIYLPNAS